MSSNQFFYTLCPRCSNFPFLYITEENPKELLIQCYHCEFYQFFPVEKYLTLMFNNEKTKLNKNNICKEHNRLHNNYCIQCRVHLCAKCTNHESHQLASVDDIIPTYQINSKVNGGYNHINEYCYQLKSKRINEYITKINKIEYSYESLKSMNNNVLQLFKNIIHNYNINTSNYYLKCNLQNITDIYIYKFNKDNTDENIIKYFKNYTLIKDSIVNISKAKCSHIINEHTDSVDSVLILSDGRLASCSHDKTIKIYNMNNNYKCDITINTEHTDCVANISQLENGKLVSCSGRALKIWSIYESSYKCECTIYEAHNKWINEVISLTNNRIASCAEDKLIRIWDVNRNYNLIEVLEGHESYVYSILQLKGKEKLISGGDDNNLFIWNIQTYQPETVINNIYCSYYGSLIEINKDRIISAGNKVIVVINILKSEIEQKIEDDNLGDIYSLMSLRDGNILCGSLNGKIFVYEIQQNIIQSKNIEEHTNGVTCLLSTNNYQFISCSWDGTIKLWEY